MLRASSSRVVWSLIGQPLAYERGEGAWGNREVPPPWTLRRGLVGETWFPPRERAGGDRRSSGDRLRLRRDLDMVHRQARLLAQPPDDVAPQPARPALARVGRDDDLVDPLVLHGV